MFYPLTQNTIKASKFRAQANFSWLEKKRLPGLHNLSSSITISFEFEYFFHYSTLCMHMGTQGIYM